MRNREASALGHGSDLHSSRSGTPRNGDSGPTSVRQCRSLWGNQDKRFFAARTRVRSLVWSTQRTCSSTTLASDTRLCGQVGPQVGAALQRATCPAATRGVCRVAALLGIRLHTIELRRVDRGGRTSGHLERRPLATHEPRTEGQCLVVRITRLGTGCVRSSRRSDDALRDTHRHRGR